VGFCPDQGWQLEHWQPVVDSRALLIRGLQVQVVKVVGLHSPLMMALDQALSRRAKFSMTTEFLVRGSLSAMLLGDRRMRPVVL
jgi:hypothetical protein